LHGYQGKQNYSKTAIEEMMEESERYRAMYGDDDEPVDDEEKLRLERRKMAPTIEEW
jgi:hypothetical protein